MRDPELGGHFLVGKPAYPEVQDLSLATRERSAHQNRKSTGALLRTNRLRAIEIQIRSEDTGNGFWMITAPRDAARLVLTIHAWCDVALTEAHRLSHTVVGV